MPSCCWACISAIQLWNPWVLPDHLPSPPLFELPLAFSVIVSGSQTFSNGITRKWYSGDQNTVSLSFKACAPSTSALPGLPRMDWWCQQAGNWPPGSPLHHPFPRILQKNPNELFGQPKIIPQTGEGICSQMVTKHQLQGMCALHTQKLTT